MLSGLERKTGWSLAEHAGEATMQWLSTGAKRDADLVRDDLRGYVSAARPPGGVLIGDDATAVLTVAGVLVATLPLLVLLTPEVRHTRRSEPIPLTDGHG